MATDSFDNRNNSGIRTFEGFKRRRKRRLFKIRPDFQGKPIQKDTAKNPDEVITITER